MPPRYSFRRRATGGKCVVSDLAQLNLGKPVAVAAVPNDIDAGRAVVSRLKFSEAGSQLKKWIAVPRDIDRLARATRLRLMRSYIALPEFEIGALRERIEAVAA